MDALMTLLDSNVLDLLVVAIGIFWLVGELNGEHPPAGSTERDEKAPAPAARDGEKTIR